MNTEKSKASAFYIALACVAIWAFVKCAPGLVAVESPRGSETFSFAATSAVTLAWDAPERVDGFRLYVREAGQNYVTSQDVGTNRLWRVSGLKRKTTYRFVVMAYRSGLESGPSNEVSYRTPFSPSDR